MKVEQAKPIEMTSLIAPTFCWFVLFPIFYLTWGSWNILMWGVVVFGSVSTLINDYFVLRKIAEPYEIERIRKGTAIMKKIINSLSSFNAAILLSGIFIIVASNSADGLLRIITSLFGALFTILSCQWWLEDIKHTPQTI